MHDLINSIAAAQVLAPQTIQAAPLVATAIDMQGAESLCFAVAVGAIVDTLDASKRIDVKIEHAEDDGTGAAGTYAACTDADVVGVAGLSNGIFLKVDADAKENKTHLAGYRGGKRFVRVTATPVSLATGGPIAIVAIKSNLAQRPQG